MESQREGTAGREGTAARCCSDTDVIARHFDVHVGTLVEKGEAEGLSGVSQKLLRHLLAANPAGKSILELGSGRAGLLLELLEAGASRVTGVDVSPSSIEYARSRFERGGASDRASFILGNAALLELEPHDWVILDRAICCYPDLNRMLETSVPAARELYAYTVPESRGLRGAAARVGWWIDNRIDTFRRDACRGYVHDLNRIDAALTGAGFHPIAHDHTGVWLWHVAVFQRPASPPRAGEYDRPTGRAVA